MADFSIWPATDGPNSDAGDPGADVNLGHFFQLSQVCWAKAIRFYRGATTIRGTPTGRVFKASDQTVVPSTPVTFPTLSGVGWQVATLPAPVQLAANTLYKVVVHFVDNYTATGGYWSVGAGVGGITNGPLTAPDAGGTPLGIGGVKQGSYGYTSDPNVYPDSYFGGGCYWVDLVVTDVDPNASQTIVMGLPVDEETGLPLTLSKSLIGGLPVEQSAGLAAVFSKTVLAGLPAELGEALPTFLAKAVVLGLPVETVEALPLLLGKALTLGLPSELDGGLVVTLAKALRLGLPAERDEAIALLLNDVWPPHSGAPSPAPQITTSPPTVSGSWASTGPPTTT